MPVYSNRTRQVVDPAGQLLLAQNFDPFGNVLEQGGAGQSVFWYTGEQVDPTGLVFLRARYYSPEMGRFLSPDTIVPDPLSSVGWNRYAYTGNNPVEFTDPSGLCAEFGDDACWTLYEKIKQECPECDTIVTGKGIVPLHEANYYRLQVYRQNRIVNPVCYDNFKLLREVYEGPDVVILGANAGITSGVGIGQGPTMGVEAVVNPWTGEVSTFYYDGIMTGPGLGGSISSYLGVAWNVASNVDYTEDFESITLTAAFGEGATITVFWVPDFAPDKSFGVSAGPAEGAEFSLIRSRTFYQEFATNRNWPK